MEINEPAAVPTCKVRHCCTGCSVACIAVDHAAVAPAAAFARKRLRKLQAVLEKLQDAGQGHAPCFRRQFEQAACTGACIRMNVSSVCLIMPEESPNMHAP